MSSAAVVIGALRVNINDFLYEQYKHNSYLTDIFRWYDPFRGSKTVRLRRRICVKKIGQG